MTYSLLLCILSLLALFFFLLKKMRKPNTITNLPPSPPKLPIIGNLHQLGKLPHQSLTKLSQKYGPAMLLNLGSIPTLVISSPHFAKQVLKDHDITFCSRPRTPGPGRIFYGRSDVAFSPYGDHWRNVRKIFVSHLFSPARAQSFSRARDREIGLLIDYLSEQSLNVVNLDEKVFDVVDGVVGGVAFGERFRGKFGGKMLRDIMVEIMDVIDSFSFEDFFPLFGWIVDVLSGHKAKVERCFHKLDGFLEMVLDQHLNGESRREGDDEDLVDALIGLSNEEKGFILCKEHIKAMLMNTLLGGVDTSAIVIVWAMTELLRNPRIMQKAQAEIRFTNHTKVSADDVSNFTYLKMVVKETLRLHPPAPFLVPRESMHTCQIRNEENDKIYNIQAKTRVLINAWAIGRDPKSWKNPNEFYPERFDKNDVDFRGQHFEFVTFGSGRRICPGINTSIATIELTLANLLYWFDWKVPNGMQIESVASLEEERGVTVHKKIPLTIVPIKYST